MEILGLVWAASIINYPSSAAAAGSMAERSPQHQNSVPVEGMFSFTSLIENYGWAALRLSSTAAHSSYASTTSWLASDFSPVSILPEKPDSEGSEFLSLLPVIGKGLSRIAPEISVVQDVSNASDFTDLNRWRDDWAAVAAVRIVDPAPLPVALERPSADFNGQCVPDSSAAYQRSSLVMTASPRVQVWVRGHFIGEVTGRVAAQRLADRLITLIQKEGIDPNNLKPIFGSNFAAGSFGSDILFVVDETMQAHPEVPAAVTAVQWINNLRMALDAPALDLSQVQMAMGGLAPTSQRFYGTASWYGPGFHGRKTANGERFDENALTAAHKTLPFNTQLKITNALNGKSVVVRINDRGPYIGNRSVDLSKAAAACLGSIGTGVVPYEAVILEGVPALELDELTITAELPDG